MTEERDLTDSERMTWGECPVCHAGPGVRCDGGVGIPIGRNVYGQVADGVHMGRLFNTPHRVKVTVVPA